MRRRLVFAGLVIVSALALAASARLTLSGAGVGSSEWRAYGGEKTGAKYSPLDQINKDTVRNLKIAWRQSATPLEVREGRSNAPVPASYEHTPLMIDGLVYMSTGYGTVAALDAATGVVKWFDSPFAGATAQGQGPSAGSAARGSAGTCSS
jgi:glucose dehydrogenase